MADSHLWSGEQRDDPLRAYEAAILEGITSLTASMRRGAALGRRLADAGDDPGPRAEAIAEKLGISKHTARSHVRNILGKLDAHSKLEAVMTGIKLGLVGVRGESPLAR